MQLSADTIIKWLRSDTSFSFSQCGSHEILHVILLKRQRPDTTFHISRCHLLYPYGKCYRDLAGDKIIKWLRSDTSINFSQCG